MNKFIRNSVFFVGPIIVFMFVADWVLSMRLRQSRDGEFSVWNDIYRGNVNADVVVYGSSRAMVHMDPAIIMDSLNVRAYNLGINGHNFWLQYFRHLELLEHNTPPKFIIHSVDVFTLGLRPDLYNMEQFLPYMYFNEKIKRWTKPYRGYSNYDYYLPLIRYYGHYRTIGRELKSSMIRSSKPDSARYLGYASQNLAWNDDLKRAKKKFADYRIRIDTSSVKLFDQYLEECKKSGIAVILVYTPEYIQGQEFVKNRDEIIAMFRGFSDKYNIPFLDYSDDSISYNKEYFYNASHLNRKGAERFTSKMMHDIKRNVTLANYFNSSIDIEMNQASFKIEHTNLIEPNIDD